ncbi:MAG: hypothetical protein KJO58_06915, partial [Gammaproteobacteria bacterium]|nr:hypothetical protein [Gammaproteobacteria bacterium]
MSNVSFSERIKRSYRNWQRRKNRVSPSQLPRPFFHALDIDAVHEYFSACNDVQEIDAYSPAVLSGICYLCDKEVDFSVKIPTDDTAVNWRETLTCPGCGLINRWRSCLHVFDAVCKPVKGDRIYLTETLSPVYQNLVSRFPSLCSSEYFPDTGFGELVQVNGIP